MITIVINAMVLYVVDNVLEWDLLTFLTDDFASVLPLLELSLLATIAVNVVYLAYDEPTFRTVMQLGLSGISLAVVLRLYDVFPFDFSDYDPAWGTVARAVLILAIVGTGIGLVVEAGRLVQALARGPAARQ
ncbi:MAG TPA: hypothetical protein VK923_15435 [Euzebyales bacterium]|nr:hypothetical protein [Euzebyales bacterium]